MSRLYHVQSVGVALRFAAETNPVGVRFNIGEKLNHNKGRVYVIGDNETYQQIFDDYMNENLFPRLDEHRSITKEEFEEIFWSAEQKVWNELAKVFPKFKRRLPWGPSKESLEEAGITMWTQDERLRAAQARYKRPRRSSGAGSSSEAVETFEIRDHGNPNENYKVGGPRNPPNATVSLYQERMDHFIFAMLLEYNTITNEQFRELVEEAEEKLKKDNEVERFFQMYPYTGNERIKYLRDNEKPDARFEILKRRYLKISEER